MITGKKIIRCFTLSHFSTESMSDIYVSPRVTVLNYAHTAIELFYLSDWLTPTQLYSRNLGGQ